MQPPGGFSVEQWWLTIKFNRRAARRMLPFIDKNDNQFNFVLTDEILRGFHVIDRKSQRDFGKGSAMQSEVDKNRCLISSLIEEAITSSQLEGASTTRKAAGAMLRSGRKPRNISEQMIYNNYLAINQIQRGTFKVKAKNAFMWCLPENPSFFKFLRGFSEYFG